MTEETFNNEINPHAPKILFIGIPYSSHNQSWIGLLSQEEFNIRFFGVTDGYPNSNWPYKTYLITTDLPFGLNPGNRLTLYPTPEEWLLYNEKLKSLPDDQKVNILPPKTRAAEPLEWLASVILKWEPDIIHTMGIDPASLSYLHCRDRFPISHVGTWIVQARGGPDLQSRDLDPNSTKDIERILNECDQFIADNSKNYQLAKQFGLKPEKISELGVIPGSGGIDVKKIRSKWNDPPSKRNRIIIWPKATENLVTRVLPVFEALKECWHKIAPCEILIFPGFSKELQFWFNSLPEEIKQNCHISNSIPRDEILELMAGSRVMLAPSLMDGIPNVLYEAMATGAFPIVSPLETLLPIFESEKNVLYARNLYPAEIENAIVKAMNDDILVDQAALNNVELVSKFADQESNTQKVKQYYRKLFSQQRVLSYIQKESLIMRQKEELAELHRQLEQINIEQQQQLQEYQRQLNESQTQLSVFQQKIIELEEAQKGMVKLPDQKIYRRLLKLLIKLDNADFAQPPK